MRRLVFVLALVCMAAIALALAPASEAQTGSLSFDPSSTVVAGGGKFFINLKCEPNSSGFLISNAFAGQPSVSEFAGVPAIPFSTGSAGTFGIGLTIDPSVRPGAYSVSVRCGGALAASGTLTVVSSLARTGAPIGLLAGVGALLVAVGLVPVVFRRRALSRTARSAGA
jgi:hypothetical protein